MKQAAKYRDHRWGAFLKCLLTSLLFIGLSTALVSAQPTNVTNKGTRIYIPSGAKLYVSGNYKDESTQAEKGIVLGGELELHGDFINNNASPEEAIFDGDFVAGYLTFAGTGDQLITGSTAYFRKLKVDKPGGTLTFGVASVIKDGLELTAGNVVLNEDITIAEENTKLTSAAPTTMSHTGAVVSGSGSIRASRPALNNGDVHVDNLDVVGTGLGFTMYGGQTMSTLAIARNHQELTSLGNGVSVFRNYTFSVDQNVELSTVRFKYLENEFRSAGLLENDVAIYLSDDDGASWERIGGTVSLASDQIEVNLADPDRLFIIQNTDYLLALGAQTCSAANQPDIQFSAVSTLRTETPSSTEELNICGSELTTVTASNTKTDALSYAHWTIPNDPDVELLSATLDTDNDGTIYVNGRTVKGCLSSAQFDLTARPFPENSITSIKTFAECQYEEVQFIHSNEDENGDPLTNATYTWNFNTPDNQSGTTSDGAPLLTDPVRNFTYNTYGDKTVRVTAVSEYECAVDIELPFTVNPVPDFDFSIADLCRDELGQFDITINDAITQIGDPFSSLRKYDWDFGDGGTDNHEDVLGSIKDQFEYTYVDIGDELSTLDVTLEMEFTATECKSEVTKQIFIKPKPVVDFSAEFEGAPINEICVGEVITFENATTFSDASTNVLYDWDFGDATTSADHTPEKQYFAQGAYTTTMIAESETYGCTDMMTWDIEVRPEPLGGFQVLDKDICSEETAQFLNETTILDATPNLQYVWDFGDASTSTETQSNVLHDYADAGLYSVSLQRTSKYGCSNTLSKTIEIHPEPEADFKIENACIDDATVFTSTSTIASDAIQSQTWTFHDASEQEGATAEYIYGEAITRQVQLEVVSDYDCVHEIIKNVDPVQRPTFTLDPAVACENDFEIVPNVLLPTDIPGGSTYEWRAMKDMSVISTDPTAVVTESGNYQLVISGPTPLTCQGTNTATIYLFSDVDLGSDVTFCEKGDLEASLDDIDFLSDDDVTYSWDKDGLPVAGDVDKLEVIANGTYEVDVNINVTGFGQCSVQDEVSVTIDPKIELTVDDQSGCDGDILTLDAGVSGATYNWTQLSTGSSAGTSQQVNVTEEGQYKVDVQKGSCEASTQAEVTLFSQPVVSFEYPDQGVCESAAASFINKSFVTEQGDAIVGYQWDFGDGSAISTLENPSNTYGAFGTYDVSLTVETANGCSYSHIEQIEIHDFPNADFTVPLVCVGEVLNLSGPTGAGYSYSWSFGNGSSSALQNPATTYTLAGSYPVTLNVTNSNGCLSSIVKNVTVNPLPDLNFGGVVASCAASIELDAANSGSTYSWRNSVDFEISTDQQYEITADGDYSVIITNATGCEFEEDFSVTLNAPIQPGLGSDRQVCGSFELDAGYFDDATYAWSTGQNTREIMVTESGTYQVSVMDINGCEGTSEVTITFNDLPILDLGNDLAICDGESVILNAQNTGSTYTWSNGSDQQSIVVSTTDTYQVEVTNAQGCVAQDQIQVTVNPKPVVNFALDEKCPFEPIDFTNLTSISGGGLLSYQWSFGDGSFSTQSNPTKAYTASSDYDVNLIATSIHGCESSLTSKIDVHPNPVANFILNSVCQNEEFIIDNRSSAPDGSGLTYHWSVGDGRTFTTEEPELNYTNSGDYLVNLEVTSAYGCVTSKSNTVTVNETPMLDFGGTIDRCDGSFTLDAENVGSTYKWSDNSKNQTLEVTTSGTYTVEVTSAAGCVFNESVVVEFKGSDSPIDLGDDFAACGEALLDPMVSDIAYYWSTGETTETIQVFSTGNYEVTTVSNDLCIVADDINVTINPIPEIDLGNELEACEGEVVSLDAESTLTVDYLWSTGSTSSSIQIDQAGIYNVELITDLGCSFIDEVEVLYHAIPVLEFDAVIQACDEILLDAGNFGSVFNWSTGEESKTITISESDAYGVEVTNAENCVANASFDVIISESPNLDLGPDRQICHDEIAVLESGLTDVDHLWSTLSTTSSLEVGSTGNYSLEVTSDAGCKSSDEVYIEVSPQFSVDLGEDRVDCGESDLMLDAGIEGYTYQWQSDSGFVSTDQNIIGNTSGRYWVTVSDDLGCMESDTIYIAPTDMKIKAGFLSSSIGDRGDTIQFAQLSEPTPETFLWNFGDGQFSNLENPQHRYLVDGEFDVTLTVSNEVCTDELTKSLTIRLARSSEDEEVEIAKFLEILELKAYPNPVRDQFSLYLELSKEESTHIHVYDITGVLMQSQVVKGVEEEVRFDVSKLADGVYFLHASVGKRSQVIRIVKQ
ncbi:MAG: PKD domain-containing protein [Reichenbachiella sp.]|uniref:PKD domain-containing protein n=1 Tax=Reichenbachiella sp. TaxID=2184521 RepID=UPI0032669DB8